MINSKIFCIAILATAMSTGCANSQSAGIDKNSAVSSAAAATSETITYDLKNFSKINAGYAYKIHFTQGKDYSVRLESVPEKVRQFIVVNVKDGTLNLDAAQKRFKETRGDVQIDAYVSAPTIENVSISGYCDFIADEISNKGNFKFCCAGASTCNISKLSAKQITYKVAGAAKLYMPNIKAGNVDFAVAGAGKIKSNIEANTLVMENSGAVEGTVKFRGDRANLQNSGACKLDVNVDCKTLKSQCSGATKLKLSGVAEKVNVENSGVATTNTSELNNL